MDAIFGLIQLVLTLISGVGQQLLGGWSANIRGSLNSLAKELAKKLSQNATLKEKFLNAVNNKNSKLATSMMIGMGFGPRMESLRRDLDSNEELLQRGTEYYNNNHKKIEALLNEATNASYNAGTVTGNISAQASAGGISDEMSKLEDPVDLTQNIEGGITK